MTSEQILDDIREANLSYLLLAQNLVRHDRAEAMYRLGLSEEVAGILANLSTAQILRIASRNVLIARFRFDDDVVWGLLTDHGVKSTTHGIHAAIVMASKTAEAVA